MTSVKIPLVKVAMAPESVLLPMLKKVLYSGQIGEGENVLEFEREFARHFQLPSALSFHSGTAALHCALAQAGVRPGDEVISTPMTAEPTNVSILHTGAKVVWADVDARSGNIDPESIRHRMTGRTKAIMVVHYGGLPARLKEILKISREFGVPVIEDCAHALGARYQDRHVGVHGHYGMYSLQAIKHMTTVDGGMLTLQDDAQARDCRLFRWFGLDRAVSRADADISTVGYKYHMNNVTAAIGLAQLTCADSVIGRHIDNGRFFDAALPSIPGISVAGFEPHAEPSYWIYTILSDDSDQVIAKLTDRGVAASKLHKRNDRHSIFSSSRTELPGLDEYYRRMVHIPCGWWVSDEDRNFIVDTLRTG